MEHLVETALREGSITFWRSDAERLDARYTLAVQLHLDGGLDLVRTWGSCPRRPSRHLPRPNRKVTHHRDAASLERALSRAVCLRQDRGYRANPLPHPARHLAAA